MKILLTGIFLVCLNTFTGSTFDAITKYSGINNYMWYHYYSIGGSVAICCFIIFLLSQGGLKKHILLEKKEYTVELPNDFDSVSNYIADNTNV